MNNPKSIRTCSQCENVIGKRSKSGLCQSCSGLRWARPNRLGAQGFWEKVDQTGGPDASWERQGSRNRDGYGRMWRVTDDGLFTRAHRFAWYLTNGSIPKGILVRHKCDNRPCCNPSHLELGTIIENNEDCKLRGRNIYLKGLDLPQTRIGPEEIAEMRRLRESGVPRAEVARRFGLSEGRVTALVPVAWRGDCGRRGRRGGRGEETT